MTRVKRVGGIVALTGVLFWGGVFFGATTPQPTAAVTPVFDTTTLGELVQIRITLAEMNANLAAIRAHLALRAPHDTQAPATPPTDTAP